MASFLPQLITSTPSFFIFFFFSQYSISSSLVTSTMSASTSTTNSFLNNVEQYHQEAITLLTWKASLDNQSESFLSWFGGNACHHWYGVACHRSGRVSNLDLHNCGLKGKFGVGNDGSRCCKLKFLELKAKRNHRFIICKIEDNIQQVVVEKLGSPDESYDVFTSSLPANECRYAVFDFDFTTDENCQKSKIFFIAWAPDTSRVRSKMLYASSKDRFKRELDGIQVELQATDPSEMSLDIVKSRAM